MAYSTYSPTLVSLHPISDTLQTLVAGTACLSSFSSTWLVSGLRNAVHIRSSGAWLCISMNTRAVFNGPMVMLLMLHSSRSRVRTVDSSRLSGWLESHLFSRHQPRSSLMVQQQRYLQFGECGVSVQKDPSQDGETFDAKYSAGRPYYTSDRWTSLAKARHTWVNDTKTHYSSESIMVAALLYNLVLQSLTSASFSTLRANSISTLS